MADQDSPISLISRSLDHLRSEFRKSKFNAIIILAILISLGLFLGFPTLKEMWLFVNQTSVKPSSPSMPSVPPIVGSPDKSKAPTLTQESAKHLTGNRALPTPPASRISPREDAFSGLHKSPAPGSKLGISNNKETHTTDTLIAKELHDKNVYKKLKDAATRLNPDTDTEAILRLYRDALNQLSPEARRRLDQALLNAADVEFQLGRSISAAEKYRQLFSGYQ